MSRSPINYDQVIFYLRMIHVCVGGGGLSGYPNLTLPEVNCGVPKDAKWYSVGNWPTVSDRNNHSGWILGARCIVGILCILYRMPGQATSDSSQSRPVSQVILRL